MSFLDDTQSTSHLFFQHRRSCPFQYHYRETQLCIMRGPGADNGLSVTKRSDYAIEPIQQSKSQGRGCKTITSLESRTCQPFQAKHEERAIPSISKPAYSFNTFNATRCGYSNYPVSEKSETSLLCVRVLPQISLMVFASTSLVKSKSSSSFLRWMLLLSKIMAAFMVLSVGRLK